ncbi:MAG: hypothetical protein CBC42_00865 [Betaproteobacteria bacterium TMED82]|nr:MAG: hypothetical protein CBC42_00865 [Betaproteobacteria bacterium TMED82]
MKLRLNLSIFMFFLLPLQICFAHDHSTKGTEEEAKILLERAINILKVNEVVGLTMITIPSGGFHTKDLYPFCFNLDGVLMAHPYNLGASIKNFTSEDGKKLGEEMLTKAEEGKLSKISYVLPIYENGKLTEKKAEKTTLYTKVGGFVCASGFYK